MSKASRIFSEAGQHWAEWRTQRPILVSRTGIPARSSFTGWQCHKNIDYWQKSGMLLHLPVRSAKLFFKLAILFVCLTTDGRAAVRSEERRVGKECRSRW